MSDAIFIMIPQVILRGTAVREHLLLFGVAEDRLKRASSKYWQSTARLVVSGPQALRERLTSVYDFLKDLIGFLPQRNFISEHAKRFKVEMSYVLRGNLSDVPGVPCTRRAEQMDR